jgi:hypothetical protein
MCEEVNAIAWKLATTPPTTLAGVAAVLRFANEVEDVGGDWPDTDTIGPDGWHLPAEGDHGRGDRSREGGAVMSNVVNFPEPASLFPKRRQPLARAGILSRISRVEIEQVQPDCDEGETFTSRNRHLRDARKDAWRKADSLRQYWKVRMEMESAISCAQSHGLPEGNNHPPHNPDERWTLLAKWRQAIAQQLLTPAPDTAAVAWKKAAQAGGQHEYTDVKSERIERAIAMIWHFSPRIRYAGQAVKKWRIGASSRTRCGSASGTSPQAATSLRRTSRV